MATVRKTQRMTTGGTIDPTQDNAINRAKGNVSAALPDKNARPANRWRPFSALARRVIQPGGGAAGSQRGRLELTQEALTPAPLTHDAAVEAALGEGSSGGSRAVQPGRAVTTSASGHFRSQASPRAMREASDQAQAAINRAEGRSAGGLIAGEERREEGLARN